MPSYVDRIDEIVARPPYVLNQHRSHGFFTPARWHTLQELTDRYLNHPLGSGAPVYFAVPWPPLGNRAYVSFNHYGVAAATTGNSGWFAYTEALISYLVLVMDPKRWAPRIQASAWHMPCLYLDGATPDDPGSVPMVLGRESFGLPKNPGRIQYAPTDPHGLATTAELGIFDCDPFGGTGTPQNRYEPRPAIRLEPGEKLAEPDSDVDAFYGSFLGRATGVERGSFRTPWRDEQGNLLPVGTGFDVETPDLVVRATGRSEPGPNEDVAVPAVRFVFGYELLAPLLGLCQFRHPKTPTTSSFQAVVESHAMAQVKTTVLIPYYYRAAFPTLQRLDLAREIGMYAATRNGAPVPLVFYRDADSRYADPKRTRVWPAP